jgi:hypothetical protein
VHTQEIVTLFELTNLCPIRSDYGRGPMECSLQKKHGDDLGARMAKVFKKFFALDMKSVCIIGSDCYELYI